MKVLQKENNLKIGKQINPIEWLINTVWGSHFTHSQGSTAHEVGKFQQMHNFVHILPVNSSSSLDLHPVQGEVNLPDKGGHSFHNGVGHAQHHTGLLPHDPEEKREVLLNQQENCPQAPHPNSPLLPGTLWQNTGLPSFQPSPNEMALRAGTVLEAGCQSCCLAQFPSPSAAGWTGAMWALVYEPPSPFPPHTGLLWLRKMFILSPGSSLPALLPISVSCSCSVSPSYHIRIFLYVKSDALKNKTPALHFKYSLFPVAKTTKNWSIF